MASVLSRARPERNGCCACMVRRRRLRCWVRAEIKLVLFRGVIVSGPLRSKWADRFWGHTWWIFGPDPTPAPSDEDKFSETRIECQKIKSALT